MGPRPTVGIHPVRSSCQHVELPDGKGRCVKEEPPEAETNRRLPPREVIVPACGAAESGGSVRRREIPWDARPTAVITP